MQMTNKTRHRMKQRHFLLPDEFWVFISHHLFWWTIFVWSLSWLNKQESSSNSESCAICKLQRGIIAHLLLKFGNWNLETCQRMRIIYHLVLFLKRIMWGRIGAWFSITLSWMVYLFVFEFGQNTWHQYKCTFCHMA